MSESGTIIIQATNSEGEDTLTIPFTIADAVVAEAPGVPSTPTRTSRTSTSLTLATTQGSGGTPTLYRWRYSTNSTVSDSDPMVTSTNPNVTITGLNADTNYWIDVRAENDDGESNYSGNLATATAEATPTNVAPNWSDDTGDAQSWTQNSAISSITVPVATGTPTPTYSASGLPAGVSFNTSTRLISGTPTSTGSGTITITAMNSEGSDTWTVAYTTVAETVEPDIAVQDVTIDVEEGSNAGIIRVRLSSQPAIDVVVTVTETDPDITFAGLKSKTFTPDNWNTYQSFFVTGVQDADSDDDTAIVTLTATGGSTDTATVTVTILDDD